MSPSAAQTTHSSPGSPAQPEPARHSAQSASNRSGAATGEFFRATLVDGPAPSVVVKSIRPPSSQRHPRGWASSRSHERKLRSYEVEKTFYASHAARTHAACRLPACLAATAFADGQAFVLEDLDGAGFGARRASLSPSVLRVALRWLAEFHTLFLGDAAKGSGTRARTGTSRRGPTSGTRRPTLA